jgi:uncharacterized protein YecE (DUF72 family)
MSRTHIGISGWTYAGWRGDFYPAGLPHRRELEYASRTFDTIEINGTFYSLQRPASFEKWHQETPRGFRFAVKCSRFITHMKQLNDVETPLANFFASGVLRLEEKLGPLLWQFAPRRRFDRDRFTAFLDMLPRDTFSASALARGHDARLDGRSSYDVSVNRPIRYAFEVRHESFMTAEFMALLREQDVAFVFSDAASDWPYAEDVTSGFVYIRLHGAEETYASGYGDAALERWAHRIRTWSRGGQVEDARLASPKAAPKRAKRDVFVYFDNDVKVHAPYDAATLMRKLGQESALGEQGQPVWPPGWQAPALRTGGEGFSRRAPR